MLSGIGPAEQLREVGIEVRVDSPGVGENLQDHPEGLVQWNAVQTMPTEVGAVVGDRHLRRHRGPNRPARPDVPLGSVPFDLNLLALRLPQAPRTRFCLTPNVTGAQSKGTVRLRTRDYRDKPKVDPRYFTHEHDREVMIRGVRVAREIAAAPALKDWVGKEQAPGDAARRPTRRCFEDISKTHNTVYHPSCTVKMGPDSDPMAPVDPQLRVRRRRRPAGRRRVDHARPHHRQPLHHHNDDRRALRRLHQARELRAGRPDRLPVEPTGDGRPAGPWPGTGAVIRRRSRACGRAAVGTPGAMSGTVILDVDGTLVDTNYHHAIAWYRGLHAAVQRDDPRSGPSTARIGMGGDQLVGAVAGDEVEERHRRRHPRGRGPRQADAMLDEFSPLPGAHALLEAIRDQGPRPGDGQLGQAAPRRALRRSSSRAGDLADAWVSSGDVEQTKPAPDLMAVAMERVGGRGGRGHRRLRLGLPGRGGLRRPRGGRADRRLLERGAARLRRRLGLRVGRRAHQGRRLPRAARAAVHTDRS